MKTNYLGLMAVALIVGATGCQKDFDESAGASALETKVVSIGVSIPTSKLDYVEGEETTRLLQWSTGDALGVYNSATANVKFTLDGGAGETSGSFTGEVTYPASDEALYAVSPYDAAGSFSTASSSFTFPFSLPYEQQADYSALSTSFGDYIYMMGYTTNTLASGDAINMTMNSAMAIIEFKLTGLSSTTVKSITIHSDQELIAAADLTVSTDNGSISVASTATMFSSVVEINNAEATSNDLILYMSMFPQTIAAGTTWDVNIITEEDDSTFPTSYKGYKFTKNFTAAKEYKAGLFYREYGRGTTDELDLALSGEATEITKFGFAEDMLDDIWEKADDDSNPDPVFANGSYTFVTGGSAVRSAVITTDYVKVQDGSRYKVTFPASAIVGTPNVQMLITKDIDDMTTGDVDASWTSFSLAGRFTFAANNKYTMNWNIYKDPGGIVNTNITNNGIDTSGITPAKYDSAAATPSANAGTSYSATDYFEIELKSDLLDIDTKVAPLLAGYTYNDSTILLEVVLRQFNAAGELLLESQFYTLGFISSLTYNLCYFAVGQNVQPGDGIKIQIGSMENTGITDGSNATLTSWDFYYEAPEDPSDSGTGGIETGGMSSGD